MVLGLVGTVLRAVVGRLVVLAGVHTEHGEIAGVAGPHPVVGLTAELAHRCRRGADEADVGIGLGDDDVRVVVVVEGGEGGLAVLVALERLVEKGLALDLHQGIHLGGVAYLLRDLLLGLRQQVRNVGHRLEEGDAEALGRQLPVAGHRPVAVHQVDRAWMLL